jgi:RNA polymerase sigma factor (sigma-70 family)
LRLRSDAALAERYADGDEAAFAILFERHRASVLAVCMGVLGSRHDAEDAAQESFAALAVTLRSAPPRELRAWLTRVARNAAIDAARRRRARLTSDGETPDGAALHTDVSSSHDAKDDFASLLDSIRELPESQRTALLMRELAGHSYREIGELLEIDEDAVRGLIARARVGLRARREAAELPCAAARDAIAAEPDGRRHDKTVRRHIRGCSACRSYRHALRDDARALRGIVGAAPAGGLAGGGAVVGLAAKGALLGGAVTQLTAACAVSVCAVGGIVLLSPGLGAHHHAGAAAVRLPAARSGERAGRGSAARAAGSSHSFPARGGSGRAASSTARHATAHTRARTSVTVVLQSKVAIAHTGASTAGRASAGAHHISGTTPPSSSPTSGGSTAPSAPPSGSSSAGSAPTGAPAGAHGAGGGSWPGSSPGTWGAGATSDPWHAGPTGGGTCDPWSANNSGSNSASSAGSSYGSRSSRGGSGSSCEPAGSSGGSSQPQNSG